MPIATETPNARTIDAVVTIVDQPARYADQLRQADADEDADDAAGQRDDRRLDQELADDVALARADRAADADLARPLEDARQHDVHDPDAADEQRDRRDRHHHHLEDPLRAPLLGEQLGRRDDGEVAGAAVRRRRGCRAAAPRPPGMSALGCICR